MRGRSEDMKIIRRRLQRESDRGGGAALTVSKNRRRDIVGRTLISVTRHSFVGVNKCEEVFVVTPRTLL